MLFGTAPEKIRREYTGMFAIGSKDNMPQMPPPPMPGGDMPGGEGPGGPPAPGGFNPFSPAGKKPAFAAAELKDGKVTLTPGAKISGEITLPAVKDITLQVENDGWLGGIYADGETASLTGSEIRLSGNGIHLGGKSAGACVDNGGELTIRGCHIETDGSARCATSAENGSVLRVYDSTLISHGAPFGSELPPGAFMATPPAALEIDGNCRTHVTMGGSDSYFYNSRIIADGWAALSTDISNGWVYLEANDCEVKTVNSGYGAYADGGCHDVLNRCKVDVASMAIIAAGECTAEFNDCDCTCGSYFLLSHCIGTPVEVTEVDVRGGKVHTKAPFAILKSCNIRLDIAGTAITSDSGILVKTIVNDDPKADQAAHPNAPVYGYRISLKDTQVRGDVLHGDHAARPLYLRLENASLTGAIDHGYLAMDDASRWYAPADSVIGIDGAIDPAQIDAPAGVTVSVINGEAAEEHALASGGMLKVLPAEA